MRVLKKNTGDEIKIEIILSPEDIPFILKDLDKAAGMSHYLSQLVTKIVTRLREVLGGG